MGRQPAYAGTQTGAEQRLKIMRPASSLWAGWWIYHRLKPRFRRGGGVRQGGVLCPEAAQHQPLRKGLIIYVARSLELRALGRRTPSIRSSTFARIGFAVRLFALFRH